jgi:hypothetical protein
MAPAARLLEPREARVRERLDGAPAAFTGVRRLLTLRAPCDRVLPARERPAAPRLAPLRVLAAVRALVRVRLERPPIGRLAVAREPELRVLPVPRRPVLAVRVLPRRELPPRALPPLELRLRVLAPRELPPRELALRDAAPRRRLAVARDRLDRAARLPRERPAFPPELFAGFETLICRSSISPPTRVPRAARTSRRSRRRVPPLASGEMLRLRHRCVRRFWRSGPRRRMPPHGR